MSWDCTLVDKRTGKPLEGEAPHNFTGGTYQVGGTKELTLNITYNYGKIFRKVLGGEGLNDLSGMRGLESIRFLLNGADQLKGEPDDDYWAATEGNARKALMDLVELATMRPDGVWQLS